MCHSHLEKFLLAFLTGPAGSCGSLKQCLGAANLSLRSFSRCWDMPRLNIKTWQSCLAASSPILCMHAWYAGLSDPSLCTLQNITCDVEEIDASYVNTAMDRLVKNDVHYRYVFAGSSAVS